MNNETIKLFLIAQTSDEKSLQDFGHLIIPEDSKLNQEALHYIKLNFKKFCEVNDQALNEGSEKEAEKPKQEIKYLSFEDICKMATDLLPDSPYTQQLVKTHDQMNKYISVLETVLMESTARELISAHKMGPDAAMVGAQIELTKIKQMFAPRTTVDLKEKSDLNG